MSILKFVEGGGRKIMDVSVGGYTLGVLTLIKKFFYQFNLLEDFVVNGPGAQQTPT
jgi:hypothetical protein